MTTVPTLDELPDWPNPDSVDFDSKIGPFTLSLPTLVQQFNASIAAYNLTVSFPDGEVYQAQSNLLDTTSGRLMKVGAFGLGSSAVDLGEGDDLNEIVVTGFFYNSTAGNTPGNNYPVSVAGGLISLRDNAARGAQIYQSYTGEGIYWRSNAGGWLDWQEIYTNESILGPVSQSGGVPTGAVMQRGSNANGEFVRFADGTQICTSKLTSGDPAGKLWTFPAAFLSRPDCSVAPSATAPRMATVANPDGTSVSIHIWNEDGVASSTSWYATAIGRWF